MLKFSRAEWELQVLSMVSAAPGWSILHACSSDSSSIFYNDERPFWLAPIAAWAHCLVLKCAPETGLTAGGEAILPLVCDGISLEPFVDSPDFVTILDPLDKISDWKDDIESHRKWMDGELETP